MLQFRGRLYSIVGANDDARRDLDAAVGTFEHIGDLPRLASALRTLGGVLTDAGEHDAGVVVLRRALDVARQVGHAEEIGAASLNLGWAMEQEDRFDEALACTEEAMAAFASIGLMSGVANAKVNQSDILLDLGRPDEAHAVAAEAADLARQTGNKRWEAGALADMAEAAFQQGDYAAAVRYDLESIEIFETLGDEYHGSLGRARLDKARAAIEAAG